MLTDPRKREIYDAIGAEGLAAGVDIVPYDGDFQRRWEEIKAARARAAGSDAELKSTTTVQLDARPLIRFLRTNRQRGPLFAGETCTPFYSTFRHAPQSPAHEASLNAHPSTQATVMTRCVSVCGRNQESSCRLRVCLLGAATARGGSISTSLRTQLTPTLVVGGQGQLVTRRGVVQAGPGQMALLDVGQGAFTTTVDWQQSQDNHFQVTSALLCNSSRILLSATSSSSPVFFPLPFPPPKTCVRFRTRPFFSLLSLHPPSSALFSLLTHCPSVPCTAPTDSSLLQMALTMGSDGPVAALWMSRNVTESDQVAIQVQQQLAQGGRGAEAAWVPTLVVHLHRTLTVAPSNNAALLSWAVGPESGLSLTLVCCAVVLLGVRPSAIRLPCSR